MKYYAPFQLKGLQECFVSHLKVRLRTNWLSVLARFRHELSAQKSLIFVIYLLWVLHLFSETVCFTWVAKLPLLDTFISTFAYWLHFFIFSALWLFEKMFTILKEFSIYLLEISCIHTYLIAMYFLILYIHPSFACFYIQISMNHT